MSAFFVELKDIPPIIENGSGAVRIVSLKPSLFFKPITLPQSDGAGPGYMRTSVMLRPPVFE